MFGPYVQLGCKILPVSPSLLFAPWVMIMMGSNNIQQHAWPHSLSTASCTWVENIQLAKKKGGICLLYTSPSPRDLSTSRMPSSA